MLLDRFDAFFFDLDGVIYIGDQLLPGADQLLDTLRRRGKAIRFLTNEPRLRRDEFVRRLHRMGVSTTREEIISVGYATAHWLAGRFPPGSPVFVVGNQALKAEIAAAGMNIVDDAQAEASTLPAVVIGFDTGVTSTQLVKAAQLVQSGAEFVVTSEDAGYPTPSGPAPATGVLVAQVKAVTGIQPHVIGKPAPYMFDLARKDLPARQRIIMIGDNVHTDIAGAKAAGLAAVWINHGHGDPASAELDKRYFADLVIPGIHRLLDHL